MDPGDFARVALVVTRHGLESIALMGDRSEARAAAAHIYDQIEPEVSGFGDRVAKVLGVQPENRQFLEGGRQC